MSAPPPPAPEGSPTRSPPPPSGGAIAPEPDSPSDDTTSPSPPRPAPGSSSISSSSTPRPAALGSGGGALAPPPPTPPACAACRHGRRKCSPDCILAPYFPASDPDKFHSVLRLFGVKNLLRILQKVPQPWRDTCVQTVVYESRMRVEDPVRGCAGVVEDLKAQLMDTEVELEVLRRRLESYRQAKRGDLLQLLPLPNPSHGRAAAMPREVTYLDAARQQSGSASDRVMQPSMAELAAAPPQLPATQPHQGPYGGAWPTGMTALAAPPPQLPETQPYQGPYGGTSPTGMAELAAAPPQPQLPETQPPPQFSAMEPPSSPRGRQTTPARDSDE